MNSIAKRTLLLTLPCLAACGSISNSTHLMGNSSKVPSSISLRCSQFKSSDFQGSIEGEIELDPTSHRIVGQVQVITQGSSDRKGTYEVTMSGHFVPADPQEHFKTNYIDASFFGGTPISGASISFWPERDLTPFSAIYDKDGFRFGMDCSSSVFHF